MKVERQLLLAGHPRGAAEGVDVRAPWDGRVIARVALAGPAEATFAADAADRAFTETRRLPARRRAAILAALGEALRASREPLARLLSDEAGKPRTVARAEIEGAAATVERAAEEAHRIAAELSPTAGRLALTRAIPRGPVLALTRFEQPLGCAAQVVGPAVAAGCPVVIRPALSTPSAALALGEMLVDAGWPAEAISVLPCDDAVAAALVADPRFATLALSPNTPPAAWIAAKLRKRHVLLACAPPVTLMIEDDADLDRAIPTIVRGAYAHAGQTRGWAQRVLVHADVWDEVCARFAAAASAVPRGDPARDDVVCGPLIDGRGMARAEAWIRSAEQLGGKRLVGGQREGTVLAPAAIAAEAPYYELLEGAPYGPVAVLEPYRGLDAGIDRVNRQPRPGDTALFTRCVAKVWRAFERLDGGSLVHDTHPDLAAREPYTVRATIDELLSPRTLVMAGPEMAH